MRDTLARTMTVIACLAVIVLAWNGNLGKALACLISPGIVEVIVHGGSQSTTGSSSAHPQASTQAN